jgi:programmed cell death 6-interacting protein
LLAIQRALSTWNLPASIEDVGNAGSNKIPQSLLDKSQTIKEKGGITQIDRLMSDLPMLLQRNTEILNETKRILEDEEKSDTELRTQLKDKWSRTSSKQLNESLFNEIKQYEQMAENAIKANRVIEEKYRRHRDAIILLSKSEQEIVQSLPAANAVAALQNTHIIKDLKRLMNEVEALRNVREVLESEIKAVDSDSIKAKLVSQLQASNGIDEHSIIQNELDALLNPLRKQVRDNIQEQEKLLNYIEKANSEFCKEKVVNETSKLRDEMLKNLAAAHDGFTELYSNLQEGNQVGKSNNIFNEEINVFF